MNKVKICIPKGCFRGGDCCGDCLYLDMNSKRDYSDEWFCVKKDLWKRATDTVARYCDYFRSR